MRVEAEKGIKEKRALVLACVIFGISIVFGFNYLISGLSSQNGLDASQISKMSPFFLFAFSMVIYSISLLKKIKDLS